MKITIIGGGHVGTLMAAEFAYKGHAVTVYTSKPEQWSRHLTVYGRHMDVVLESDMACIMDDIAQAVCDAEWIWIVLPAFLFSDMAEKLLPFVRKGQKIGIVPGSGGAEFAFRGLVEKGCTLFGMQRVHSIARLEQYGHSVHMLGRKNHLELAAIPAGEAPLIAEVVESLFEIPVEVLPNYLCVTLTPSNPVLHTSRLYGIFEDYKEGMTYPENILFYEGWDDRSSEILFRCDAELQQICAALDRLDLRSVISLPVYYESPTTEALTYKIAHIPAFQGLTSPMKQTENGWVPDFSSRYFRADFPYGLKILLDVGVLAGVPTPYMTEVWQWFCRVTADEHAQYFRIPCKNREELYRIYV